MASRPLRAVFRCTDLRTAHAGLRLCAKPTRNSNNGIQNACNIRIRCSPRSGLTRKSGFLPLPWSSSWSSSTPAFRRTGPVRPNNEDCIAFFQPSDVEEQRARGALAVLADGVGGQGHGRGRQPTRRGDGAAGFPGRPPGNLPPKQALWQMFTAANMAVYDQGMDRRESRAHGHHADDLAVPPQRSHDRPRGRLPRVSRSRRAGSSRSPPTIPTPPCN